jgi:hypothetical protein
VVVIGAAAMIGFSAETFAGRPELGHFTDAGAVATGLQEYMGRTPAICFAIALIDACIIGAAAVSLSTAYAIGDVFRVNHSLHRKPSEAKSFYLVYFVLIAIAAALVLTPGTPLGLLTNLVQTLAGVLLPSATVFLLLLCNDKEVLGPWVNSKTTNVFTTIIIAALVMLSVVLTSAVLFPHITDGQILTVLVGGTVLGLLLTLGVRYYERSVGFVTANESTPVPNNPLIRLYWRMPPLDQLAPAHMSLLSRTWLAVLRLYLAVAAGLLVLKLIHMSIGGQ